MQTPETNTCSHWIIRTTDFKQTDLPSDVTVTAKGKMDVEAFKRLGFFWLLALGSVLLPVLHFVLVPAFLLIGIFAFFSQMKSTHVIKQGKFTCPNCSSPMDLKNFYFKNDQRFQCATCRQQLVISCAETSH